MYTYCIRKNVQLYNNKIVIKNKLFTTFDINHEIIKYKLEKIQMQ